MISFMEQARLFAVYHQRPLTRYVQLVGTLSLLLAIMIILSCLHLTIPKILDINFGFIVACLLIIGYAYLNWQLTLVFAPILLLLAWIGSLFSSPAPTLFTIWVFIIALVIGFILQFAGFYVEGNRPSTLQEKKTQLIIAPLFMIAELFFMCGQMQQLKEKIYGTEPEHH